MPLPSFTTSPLVTRNDLLTSLSSIIAPLEAHRSPGGARVKVTPSACALFDDVAAQLEGFARPLLGIHAIVDNDKLLSTWIKGLENGVDRESGEYWGDLGGFDQRMVETESICLAILSYPDVLLPKISSKGKENLINWLSQINGKAMPANNWRWFRIFTNLTLTQHLNVPVSSVQDVLDSDFALLDSFYEGQGWSSDGPWGEERRQADYYSGSFAMQFAQLLYVKFAKGDEERKEKYRGWAREFGADHWRYFDIDGAAIPFGRSMTYRFAFAAFWTAVAVAGVELPSPVNELGTVKGLLLRHLRWWSKQPSIFNSDGVMNIGFTYPNMYLAEDYNSPQSVYWCLKSTLVLLLPESHPFWQVEELTHPMAQKAKELAPCKTIWPPRQIVDSSPAHHYFLSGGQMTIMPHKAREAKYCKFAYSSAFGFSVPSTGGGTLVQLAPDSTLSVSIDGGESFRPRWNTRDAELGSVLVAGQEVDALKGVWTPWKKLDLHIESTIVPLGDSYPGWHVRVHRVSWTKEAEDKLLDDKIRLVDGGFAIPALTEGGFHIPEAKAQDLQSTTSRDYEGWSATADRDALVRSKRGVGGIVDLRAEEGFGDVPGRETEAFVLRADPNTNLVTPRTLIPCVRHELAPGSGASGQQREVWLATGVFACSSRVSQDEAVKFWLRKPRVSRDAEGRIAVD